MKIIGNTYTFNYPEHYSMFPEHKAHSGQRVTIVRKLDSDEGEEDCFRVVAADGWEGDVFASELSE